MEIIIFIIAFVAISSYAVDYFSKDQSKLDTTTSNANDFQNNRSQVDVFPEKNQKIDHYEIKKANEAREYFENHRTKINTAPKHEVSTINTKTDYTAKDDNDKNTITNIYIQQNTVNIQVNNNHSKKGSGGHTEQVWKKLGYKVKHGESYAYKHYGQEIYTKDQVVAIASYGSVLSLDGLSKNQKKVKTLGQALLEKVGSKRIAKDILVREYDFDEETAKYALGYRGYENY